MTIRIRQAEVTRDQDALISILQRNLTFAPTDRRLKWLYVDCPLGQARVWVAVNASNNSVVGAAAAFPRRLNLRNGEMVGWVLGDFCLDAQYRSLGPALRLQRACLSVLETSNGAFCYDFPSASMLAVYKRLGFSPAGRMLRLAKLLRVDRKIREVVKIPGVERVFSRVGNVALKALTDTRTADPSLKITEHFGPFGEEFSTLDCKLKSRLGVRVQRSAEYLNWRYSDNPLACHKCLTARQNGVLKGYLVWSETGEDACVVDMLAEDDQAIVAVLVREVISILRKSAVVTLSVWLNEFHPWASWYADMGFRVRDSTPIVCVSVPSLADVMNFKATKWFLMQGDRDS